MENGKGRKELPQTRVPEYLQLKEIRKMIKKNPGLSVTQLCLVIDD